MSSLKGNVGKNPSIIPSLIVGNVEKSTEFLKKAFGFEVTQGIQGGNGICLRHKDGAIVSLIPENSPGNTAKTPKNSGLEAPFQLYLYCEDVDNFCKHAEQAGAKIKAKPVDESWGDRVAQLIDQDGYQWSFATSKGTGKSSTF